MLDQPPNLASPGVETKANATGHDKAARALMAMCLAAACTSRKARSKWQASKIAVAPASAANISTMRRALSAAWAAAACSLTRATSKRSPPISVASIKSVIAWIGNALAAASRASARPTMACTVLSSRRRALLPRRAFLAALAARCVPRLSALQDSATAPANRHLHASRRTRIAGTHAPEWLQSIRGGRSAMARSRTPLRLAVLVAAGRYEREGTRGHSPGCGWSLPSLHRCIFCAGRALAVSLVYVIAPQQSEGTPAVLVRRPEWVAPLSARRWAPILARTSSETLGAVGGRYRWQWFCAVC